MNKFKIPPSKKLSISLPSGKTFIIVASVDSSAQIVGTNPLTGRPKLGESCKTIRFTKAGEPELIPNASLVVDNETFVIESVKGSTVVAKHFL
jgi:hypothetical protein